MTDHIKDSDDDALNAFFAAAKNDTAEPSDDLMAAVLRDAQSVQQAKTAEPTLRAAKQSWWRDVFQTLGGWQAAGALTACAAVGVWIGYASPDNLSDISDAIWSTTGLSESSDYYSPMADLMAES